MTLDDVVATMRDRFTAAHGTPAAGMATITAEEWNVLASLVYLRDAMQSVVADPSARSLGDAQQALMRSGAGR